jgi:hypothetical protein
MNLYAFFNCPAVSLPRGGFKASDSTFDQFLETIFREYIAALRKVSDPEHSAICERIQAAIPDIEYIAQRIAAATRQHLQGYPHQAYEEIKEALREESFNSLSSELSAFDPTAPRIPYSEFLETTLHPGMYRMRANLGLAAAGIIKRKDLFHVPFENRNLVNNSRYSIAGLPCLYLGSSTWICWEELDRPELSGCIFSRFRFAEKTTVLDFQLTPAHAWSMHEYVLKNSQSPTPVPRIDEFKARYGDHFVVSYIAYWPLIAASSIQIDSREGFFFPQHIVPQLLLQWVTKERKVDGIRYFSTRATIPDYYVSANYVFPAKEIQSRGHCSFLTKKLHLVAPVPWGVLDLIRDPHATHPLPGSPGNQNGRIQLSESATVPYIYTRFYELEVRLGAMENQPDGSGPVEA